MRVAVVGGTGPFGKALATRFHEAGIEIVIGSREAERAEAVAAELDVGAPRMRTPFAASTSSSSRRTPTRRSTRPRAEGATIGTTPVLSVASELEFTKARRLADPGRAIARRANPGGGRRRRSWRGCTRLPPRPSARGAAGRGRARLWRRREAKSLVLDLAERSSRDVRSMRSARRAPGRSRVSRQSS